MFNLTIYKCVDPHGSELDRREKIICHAVEKEMKKTIVIKKELEDGSIVEEKKEETVAPPPGVVSTASAPRNKTAMFKNAAKGMQLTNVLKKDAMQLEKKFEVKENRKVKKAENDKKQTQAEIERYVGRASEAKPGEERSDEPFEHL